jgi:hypothetical protein
MKQLILPVLAIALGVLASCDKEGDIDNTFSMPNGELHNSFIAGNLANDTQTWTVDADEGGYLIGEKGTRVIIAPGSLYWPTVPVITPVTGNVQVTLIEVYDREDMIWLDKPVMEEVWQDTLAGLVSGGQYYLSIKQNGNNVYTSGVTVYLPVDNTGGADPMMTQYDETSVLGVFAWEDAETAVSVTEIPEDTSGVDPATIFCYEVNDSQWGWTSVAHPIIAPSITTKLLAQLPTGFNPSTFRVYIAYDGMPGTLQSLPFQEGGYYSEKFGQAPIGMPVHFVAVGFIDGQLHYAIQESTIEDEHIEVISDFHPTTKSKLADIIAALP